MLIKLVIRLSDVNMGVDMICLQFEDYQTTKHLIVLPGNKKNKKIKNISMVNVFGLLAVYKNLVYH